MKRWHPAPQPATRHQATRRDPAALPRATSRSGAPQPTPARRTAPACRCPILRSSRRVIVRGRPGSPTRTSRCRNPGHGARHRRAGPPQRQQPTSRKRRSPPSLPNPAGRTLWRTTGGRRTAYPHRIRLGRNHRAPRALSPPGWKQPCPERRRSSRRKQRRGTQSYSTSRRRLSNRRRSISIHAPTPVCR